MFWSTELNARCLCAPVGTHLAIYLLVFSDCSSLAWTLMWSGLRPKFLCHTILARAGFDAGGSECLLYAWHWITSQAEGWAAGRWSQRWWWWWTLEVPPWTVLLFATAPVPPHRPIKQARGKEVVGTYNRSVHGVLVDLCGFWMTRVEDLVK